MSFVNIKEYNKLKAKVGELEARIQALESYGDATEAKAEPAPIPTIEEAVSEEPLGLEDLLETWLVDLLVEGGYPTIHEVDEAIDEDLQAISGIGGATVKRIRKALEV